MLGRLATPSKRAFKLLQFTSGIRHTSYWRNIEMGPKDPIFGVNEAFSADSDKRKLNVSIGAYRGDDGKPWVLPVVRKTEKALADQDLNMEYTLMGGAPSFNKLAIELAYGAESEAVTSNRIAGLQTLSGTGAIRIACAFLARFLPESAQDVYCPDPTYANHLPLLRDTNLRHKKYRYFDSETNGLDFEGMITDLKNAPIQSTILLHAVAHNPTGVDPTTDQWKEISQVCKERDHIIMFDSAYQGFASGDVDRDAFAPRQFVEDGHLIMLCQSFAKNFGVYGQRVGCLSVVCENADEMACVESQLRILARAMYSSPPIQGSRIVEAILSDAELTREWKSEVKIMSDRIFEMRDRLKGELVKQGSELDWEHITNQIGMFCYTGLNKDQCDKLTDEWHVFLTKNGRISMAGINSGNVEYLAEAIHAVSK